MMRTRSAGEKFHQLSWTPWEAPASHEAAMHGEYSGLSRSRLNVAPT